ncbi:MAG: hypothetical protein WB952_05770 [Terriglobales bacterium]
MASESTFAPILPRSIIPEPILPRPISAPEARQIAAKGAQEQDGFTQADILLESIVRLSRKPQTATTRSALRALILRFNCECGLDF